MNVLYVLGYYVPSNKVVPAEKLSRGSEVLCVARGSLDTVPSILIMKPTRCTNFSKLFLEQNSTCFGQFLCPSSGVQHCKRSGCSILIPLASSQHNLYDVYLLLCVQCQTPDDGQRNCLKQVEFYSKNKFEKLAYIVGIITRIYHDAQSSE